MYYIYLTIFFISFFEHRPIPYNAGEAEYCLPRFEKENFIKDIEMQ